MAASPRPSSSAASRRWRAAQRQAMAAGLPRPGRFQAAGDQLALGGQVGAARSAPSFSSRSRPASGQVVVRRMTTVASVWTHAQFIDGAAIKGNALGLRIAAGNVPSFVDLATGGWGGVDHRPDQRRRNADHGQFRLAGGRAVRLRHALDRESLRQPVCSSDGPQGDTPTDTLTAAQSIARAPWYKPERLFALLAATFIRSRRGGTCVSRRSCPISIVRPAPGCYRSSLAAAAIARAAAPYSTAKATSGLRHLHRWLAGDG